MARVQEWGACACSPWVKFQATVLKSDARPEGRSVSLEVIRYILSKQSQSQHLSGVQVLEGEPEFCMVPPQAHYPER